MKTFVQPGDIMEVTAPAALLSGAAVLVGSMFGIAIHDAASGALVNIRCSGVVNVSPKIDATAFTQGELLYWDTSPAEVTNVAVGNHLIGVASKAAASADTSAEVRLNGAFAVVGIA